MEGSKTTDVRGELPAPDEALPKASRARRHDRVVNGILLLDKPSGSTSNQVLQRIKRLYRARKAGHTGSLDPLASGMLPLCFGHATKVSAYLLDADKEYRVRAAFGAKTDTADADGRVIEESAPAVEREVLLSVLDKYRGDIEQVPPMYSALKHDGKRLYELARRGQVVSRMPRRVRIHSLELEKYDPRYPVLRVACSKGTYIRTLVEDIAAGAGVCGHVAELRRLRVWPFDAHGMVGLEELENAAADGPAALDRYLLPPDDALQRWPAIHLDAEDSRELLHGQPIVRPDAPSPGMMRAYDCQGRFLGIAEILADGRLVPRRLFVRYADISAD